MQSMQKSLFMPIFELNIASTMCLDLEQGIPNCMSLVVNHHSIQFQVLGSTMGAEGSCFCCHLHPEKNQKPLAQKHVKNQQALMMLNDSHQYNVGYLNRKRRFSPSLLHLPACNPPLVQHLQQNLKIKLASLVENPMD